MWGEWREYEREKGRKQSERKVEEGRGGEKRVTWTIEIMKLGEAKTQKRKSNISVERPIECQCESKWIWGSTLLILFLVSQLRIGLFRFIAMWRVLHPASWALAVCLGEALRLPLGSWLCYVSRVPHPTQIFNSQFLMADILVGWLPPRPNFPSPTSHPC